MWFVTQEGIDRYDGTFFKHYNLIAGNESINSFTEMNNLSMDRERVLWEVTKNGLIFKYNFDKDYFQLVLQLKKKDLISYTYIDDNNNIWLCTDHNQYLFNIDTQKLIPLINTNKYTINDLVQIDGSTYYIGTDKGVYKVKLINKTLFKVHQKKLESLPVQVNKLYYQKNKKKLFIGSFKKGIYVFDSSKQTLQLVPTILMTSVLTV